MSQNNPLFCPLQEVTASLDRKWSFQIIYEIGNHKIIRFNALQDELEWIAPKVLSDTLTKLEDENLISKKQYEEIPPRVEYRLTKDGLSLYPIIVNLLNWSVSRKNTTIKRCLCHSKPKNVI